MFVFHDFLQVLLDSIFLVPMKFQVLFRQLSASNESLGYQKFTFPPYFQQTLRLILHLAESHFYEITSTKLTLYAQHFLFYDCQVQNLSLTYLTIYCLLAPFFIVLIVLCEKVVYTCSLLSSPFLLISCGYGWASCREIAFYFFYYNLISLNYKVISFVEYLSYQNMKILLRQLHYPILLKW